MPSDNGKSAFTKYIQSKMSDRFSPVQLLEGYEWDDSVESASWADALRLIGKIEFLVPQWIPRGMVTGVIAEPKKGKTAFVEHGLVGPVVTGRSWFSNAFNPWDPQYVVWCDTEHSLAINLERAEAWGLPVERIKSWSDDPLEQIDLMNADHLERLENVILKYKAPMVVIDSLRGAHGEDENNSRFITEALKPLGTIAARTKTAVVVIHHTRKLFEDEELTMNAGRGSNAFLAMVRSQIVIDQPDSESEWLRIQVLGNNIGRAPKPIGFRWNKGQIEYGDAPRRQQKEKNNGAKDAEKWLVERMKAGKWYIAATIESEAKEKGFSVTGTLQRARTNLGITRDNGNVRKGKDKKSQWRREEITNSPGNS